MGSMKAITKVLCHGRGLDSQEFLDEPFKVEVAIAPHFNNHTICVFPEDCPHNFGLGGYKCKISHRGVKKPSEKDLPYCAYRVSIPEDFDSYRRKLTLAEQKR